MARKKKKRSIFQRKRDRLKNSPPKPNYNKTFNKRRLKQMPDWVFAPDPKERRRKRWYER